MFQMYIMLIYQDLSWDMVFVDTYQMIILLNHKSSKKDMMMQTWNLPRSNFPDSMQHNLEMQRNLEMQQQLQQILQHPGFQAREAKTLVYLPIVGWFFMVNVGKYTIAFRHGCMGPLNDILMYPPEN